MADPTPPQKNILLRAQVEHADDFRTIRLDALKSHPTAFSADIEAHKTLDYAQRIRENLGSAGAIYFAYIGDQIAGMTGVRRMYSSKTNHNAHIWGVYVKAEFRRRGLARSLMDACLHWSKENEAAIVKLAIVIPNPGVYSFYKGYGFKPYGTEPKAVKIDGVYYDEILMFKEI